jgi:hypothetical protein
VDSVVGTSGLGSLTSVDRESLAAALLKTKDRELRGLAEGTPHELGHCTPFPAGLRGPATPRSSSIRCGVAYLRRGRRPSENAGVASSTLAWATILTRRLAPVPTSVLRAAGQSSRAGGAMVLVRCTGIWPSQQPSSTRRSRGSRHERQAPARALEAPLHEPRDASRPLRPGREAQCTKPCAARAVRRSLRRSSPHRRTGERAVSARRSARLLH